MTFIELCRTSSTKASQPGEQQGWLRDELRRRLAMLELLANPGQTVTDDRVVLGIAEYSVNELALLEDLAVATSTSAREQIEQFLSERDRGD